LSVSLSTNERVGARFVDGSPDGVPFAVICLMVRVVEALGAAALITSSFAIIANTFPDNVTAMFVRTHNHTHTHAHTHTHYTGLTGSTID